MAVVEEVEAGAVEVVTMGDAACSETRIVLVSGGEDELHVPRSKKKAASVLHRCWRRRATSKKVLPNGTIVQCTIQGKVESGYLIEGCILGDQVSGVLYEVRPHQKIKPIVGAMRHLEVPAKDLDVSKMTANATGPSVYMKARPRRRIKDKNAPKKNRTGYNYFFAQERVRLKNACPEMRGEREISLAIADAWYKLTNEQKEPFQQLGIKDKERYQEEKRVYVTEVVRKLTVCHGVDHYSTELVI